MSMKIRFIDVYSYKKLNYNEEGFKTFGKMVDAEIENLEIEENAKAIFVFPIETRMGITSEAQLASFHFKASVTLEK